MAVILGNKYQSKQRANFRKIAGIYENSEKIEVENKERILGQTGTAWVAGNSASSETTGTTDTNDCCNKEPKNTEPNDPNDPNAPTAPNTPNDPDNPDNPDNPYQCECVDVGSPNADNACCVSGKECEAGRTIRVQRRGGNTAADCELPPLYGECTTAVIHFVWTGGEMWKLTTIEKVADDIDSGIEENFNKAVKYLGGGDVQNERTETTTSTVRCGGEIYKIPYTKAKRGFVVGKGWANSTASFINNPDLTSYNRGLANWDKPILKYIQNGKIYDACDPYGEPPIDCVEMCDENGNKYRVCGNGKITPINA